MMGSARAPKEDMKRRAYRDLGINAMGPKGGAHASTKNQRMRVMDPF